MIPMYVVRIGTGTLYPTRGPAPKRKGETYRGDGSERSEGPTVTRKRTGVRDVPGTGPGTVGTMGTTTQRACFKAARLEKSRRQGNENQGMPVKLREKKIHTNGARPAWARQQQVMHALTGMGEG